jgi:hypothetical protein
METKPKQSVSFSWEEENGFWIDIEFENPNDIVKICNKSKFITKKMKTKNHIEIKNIPNSISMPDINNYFTKDKINEGLMDNEDFVALLEYLEIDTTNVIL